MAKQVRSYVVVVQNINSGEFEEYVVFDVKRKPSVAKKNALDKAKLFAKQYSDEGNLVLFVMVVVEEQEDLFLNQNGEEDTKPTNWLDF